MLYCFNCGLISYMYLSHVYIHVPFSCENKYHTFQKKNKQECIFLPGILYCTNIYLSPCFLHDVVMNLWYKTRMGGPIIDCVPFYDDNF